tara:strand:+ start:204 stop:530 length:327 start_codon:yes stop_codon:yes gene_type:complete
MNIKTIQKLAKEQGFEIYEYYYEPENEGWCVYFDAHRGQNFDGNHTYLEWFFDEGITDKYGKTRPSLSITQLWDLVAENIKTCDYRVDDCENGCECGFGTTEYINGEI